MDILKNKKLTKFVLNRITKDLGDKVINPYGRELWVVDVDSKDWYIQFECNGNLWYNQKNFNDILRIFSFTDSENKHFIKLWVENFLDVKVGSVSRKNTNYQYIIDGIIRNTNNKWSLQERYGFSYQTVKKYLDFKKNTLMEDIKVINYCSYDLLVSA